jgi:hypothetical protein
VCTWRSNRASLVWLIPCGIAAAYLSVFLVRLPHNVWEFGWNSDYASGFTVPATLVRTGSGGHTVLGTYSSYLPLWFGLLTAGLPLHHALWEIAPTLLWIAAALILGWSVAQIATRRAAALAVLIVLVASPAALSVFMAAVAHNTVYPCTALLGAYLIWLARGDGRRRAAAISVPILAAIGLGLCLASDLLLVLTGLLPFALTAAIAGLRRDRGSRRVARSALATVGLALPVAAITSTIMSSLGYRTHTESFKLVPLSLLPKHAELLLTGLERLFNGYLDTGTPGTLHAGLGVACDVVMAVALLTLLVAGVRCASTFISSGLRAESQATPTQLAVALHTIYWVAAAMMACGAFALSNFWGSGREAFFLTVVFSTAAVIPLFVRSPSPARWLVPIGASIFFAASLVGLADYQVWSVVSLAHYEPEVLEFARAYGASEGYAGYWDASSLTWSSDERVEARPVFVCLHPRGADLCVFSQETVPSWYAPKPHRSFLLVEASEFYVNFLPAGLGPPLADYAFGPMQMYVYPYDIAARLGSSSHRPVRLIG